jgi:hypothetical protein
VDLLVDRLCSKSAASGLFLQIMKSVYSIVFSLADIRLKDMLTVMTSPPKCSVAVHIETDNTLTCSDDFTRLTNAHV